MMGAIPHWYDDPKSWDTVVLGGASLPGLVKITGGKGRKVDVKSSKGSDGATLTDNGYDPAKITITLRIVSREDWETWQIIFPLIDPERPGSTRIPFDVQHPSLTAIGIRSIYVAHIDVPDLASDVLTIKLDAVQWFPEPKVSKTGTPKASKGNAILNAGGVRQGVTTVEHVTAPSKGPIPAG